MPMNILVVGHGAREYAIIKRLLEEGNTVEAYSSKRNYGIEQLCRKIITAPYDAKSMAGMAYYDDIDLIVVGNETALFNGIADRAASYGIKCFGPTEDASRLEKDKESTKRIVYELFPEMVAPSRIAGYTSEIVDFIDEYNYPVVLKNRNSKKEKVYIARNISDILRYMPYVDNDTIIEKYIDGDEFFIECITDGINHQFPLVLRDYPYRNDGDRGSITGSMGTVNTGDLLPYLTEEDVYKGIKCMTSVLDYMNKKKHIKYRGMLVGQFFKSDGNIYFNEFDVRPGDPEMINVLRSIDEPFTDIFMDSASGRLKNIDRNSSSTVTIYHVPQSYPGEAVPQVVNFDSSMLQNPGIFVGELIKKGKLFFTGSSRTLAVSETDKDFEKAQKNALKKSYELNLGLDYRKDIGIFKQHKKRIC